MTVKILIFVSLKMRIFIFSLSVFNSKNTKFGALDIYKPHRRFLFCFSKQLFILKYFQSLLPLYFINPRAVCRSD